MLSRIRYELTRTLQNLTADNPARPGLQQQLTAVHAALQAARSPEARHVQPGIYDLTARIFAGLFTDFDLHD